MPEPVLNIPLNINREEYPVDPDSTVRTFDDFLKVCQEKGYIKEDMSDFFQGWMTYALTGPELRASDNIMRDFGGIELTTDEVKAYDAPFPEEIYMTGIRTLPSMASMLDIEASLAAWEALKQLQPTFPHRFWSIRHARGFRENSKHSHRKYPRRNRHGPR